MEKHIHYQMILVELQRYIKRKGEFMKRILRIFYTGVLAAVTLCGCGNNEPEHYSLEAKTVSFDSFNEMEDYSSLIVRGIRQDKEENVITRKGGYVISAWSFSEFQISDIYKDDSGTVKTGDIITILENEAYDEEDNVVYHVGGYNKMVAGDEYLLFLHEGEYEGKPYYVSSGVNFGTISLQEDQRTRQHKTDIGTAGTDFSIFKDIWQEAKEKYIRE